EQRARRRLVGDEAVDDAALERRAERGDLRRALRDADARLGAARRRRHAGDPSVRSLVEDLALGVERPAEVLADRAHAHKLEKLVTADEAVAVEERVVVELAEAREPRVG